MVDALEERRRPPTRHRQGLGEPQDAHHPQPERHPDGDADENEDEDPDQRAVEGKAQIGEGRLVELLPRAWWPPQALKPGSGRLATAPVAQDMQVAHEALDDAEGPSARSRAGRRARNQAMLMRRPWRHRAELDRGEHGLDRPPQADHRERQRGEVGEEIEARLGARRQQAHQHVDADVGRARAPPPRPRSRRDRMKALARHLLVPDARVREQEATRDLDRDRFR